MESSPGKLSEDNTDRVDDVVGSTNVAPTEEGERSAGGQESLQTGVSNPSGEEGGDGYPLGKDKEPLKAEPSNTDVPNNDDDWPKFGGGQPRGDVMHPSGTGSQKPPKVLKPK